MSKSNVHPDHYKVGGRDRQDDAAAARMARAKAAKPASQQRPDRMAKKPWFQRPEPARGAAERPAETTPQKSRARTVKAKPAARKTVAGSRSATARKSRRRKARPPAKRAKTRK
jgi:hypothetical protein